MSTENRSSVAFRAYVAAEDHARANLYALLSRLYAAPADAALLRAIAGSPPLPTEDDGAALPRAWSALIAACSVIDEDAAREEFDALFGGVGQARINLHGSHAITGFMMETPLSEVRDTLRALGIARIETQSVVEDHVSALFETMRLLIVGNESNVKTGDDSGLPLKPQSVLVQRDFFDRHISAWIDQLGSKIVRDSLANFYRVVTQLMSAFMQIERESFAITA